MSCNVSTDLTKQVTSKKQPLFVIGEHPPSDITESSTEEEEQADEASDRPNTSEKPTIRRDNVTNDRETVIEITEQEDGK